MDILIPLLLSPMGAPKSAAAHQSELKVDFLQHEFLLPSKKNHGQTINDFAMVVYGGFFDDSSWLPSCLECNLQLQSRSSKG